MEEFTLYLIPLVRNLLRYAIFAGSTFMIFYVLFPGYFSRNKIQQRFAKNKDFRREVMHSLKTSFILAGVAFLIIHSSLREYTQIYTNLSDYPLWWLPVSLVLAMLVHDTYFYWMHRAVHHPKLFKHVHLVHHQSVNPSPLAAYSFHALEAVLEAAAAPLVFLLLPLHPVVIIPYVLVTMAINVYGHLGYEIAPRWFRRSFLFEIMNTSVHHNLHHAKFVGNYGLYFRIWDRLMGTEHPQYVEEYDKIQERRFGSVASSKPVLKKALFSLLLLMSLGAATVYGQISIEGTWKDEEDGGVVQIYQENGYYYGRVIGADDPAHQAKIEGREVLVLKDFQKDGEATYCCGTLYQPKHQRTLTATLTLEAADRLKIEGRYGVFTGTRVWRRM